MATEDYEKAVLLAGVLNDEFLSEHGLPAILANLMDWPVERADAAFRDAIGAGLIGGKADDTGAV